MIIDIHLHERTFSEDTKMNLLEMIEEARIKGLDGICITDHDSIGLQSYAKKVSSETGFPIFVGVEYLCCEGDIVAFGINELPEPHMMAQDFLDYVHERGGVCIAAHPYRGNSRGLGNDLYRLKHLAGIEVLNGSATPEENQKAQKACADLGLKAFGASDAHTLCQIGRYATEIPGDFRTTKELVSAIKNNTCTPLYLSGFKAL